MKTNFPNPDLPYFNTDFWATDDPEERAAIFKMSHQYHVPIGPDLPYSVALWGSKPLTDDDCWTGDEFLSREEAEEVLTLVVEQLEAGHRTWANCDNTDTAYVVLDGPDVHREVRIKSFKPARDNDNLWRNEFAMQNGMAFGAQGYNDARGY